MGPLAKALLTWGAILGGIAAAVHFAPDDPRLPAKTIPAAARAGPTPTTPPATNEQLAQRVADAYDPLKIGLVYVAKAEPLRIQLNLAYPVSRAVHPLVAQMDTRRLVRAMLKALIGAGRNPAQQGVAVIAGAYRTRKGEASPIPQLDLVGASGYDPATDSIANDPPLNLAALDRMLHAAKYGLAEGSLARDTARQLGISINLDRESFAAEVADKMRSQTGPVQRAIAEALGIY